MRDIKFRAKRLDKNLWVYGHYYQDKPTNRHKIVSDNFKEHRNYHLDIDVKTLSLSTGLMDKGGNIIFGGDITKDKRDRFFLIHWDERTASFWAELIKKPKGERTRLSHNFEVTTWADIIGNKYDNPEFF